jgi:hypothetical protein
MLGRAAGSGRIVHYLGRPGLADALAGVRLHRLGG